jgi:hypothetical protein
MEVVALKWANSFYRKVLKELYHRKIVLRNGKVLSQD